MALVHEILAVQLFLRNLLCTKCPLKHQHVTSKEKMAQFQTWDIHLQGCVPTGFNVV